MPLKRKKHPNVNCERSTHLWHKKQNHKERLKEIIDSIKIIAPTPYKIKEQIAEGSSNIEVEGHIGTWYVIDTELFALTRTVMEKLSAMSNEEFESLSGELTADFR